jgi:hypothetical protein
MSRYNEFFLNSTSNVGLLELLEISHPSFSQVYRIVRNKVDGVTVVLETGISETFDYYPVKISPTSDKNDLDQNIQIDFGDLGTVLPPELDRIADDNSWAIKPTLIYRAYRSDDLNEPLYGPITYEISQVPFKQQGASIKAGAPKLNQNATGEVYSTDRFPMLRGFI